MPAGRYAVYDGADEPARVGTEEFRCAPGPMGWRYFSDVETSDPMPHHETIDVIVDADWRPVRLRIDTGDHELFLQAQGDSLAGYRDGEPVEIPWHADTHLDYLSPSFNAVTARRLSATTEIEVVYIEPHTLEPVIERQMYELQGSEQVQAPVGAFDATRWTYTSLRGGWSADLWVAGDTVVRYDRLFELEWYDPGASGAIAR